MEKEVDLNQYLEETVVRKYEIEGILENIHGEHGVPRLQKIKGFEISETTEITEEEKTTLKGKAILKEKIRSVHTFPKDGDGNLMVPLGGERGYLMGALRWSLYDLYKDKLRSKKWEGYGMVTYLEHGIFIKSEWIPVGKKPSNVLENPKKYMVETKGVGRSMMDTYYDYVEKTPFKISIEVTNAKIPEKIFETMLAHVQRLGIGPKRRGRIKFVKVTRLK